MQLGPLVRLHARLYNKADSIMTWCELIMMQSMVEVPQGSGAKHAQVETMSLEGIGIETHLMCAAHIGSQPKLSERKRHLVQFNICWQIQPATLMLMCHCRAIPA